MNKRYIELDCAKGLAILLLIFSHCFPGEGIIKTWIFSFHMPIFFIICGILQYNKTSQGISYGQFLPYLKKRTKQLLIPYYFWGMILIIFYQVLKIISGMRLTVDTYLFALLTWQGIDSLWFIPCYLIAEVMFIFIYLRLKNGTRKVTFVILIILVFTGSITGMPELGVLRLAMKCIIAFIFIACGYYVAKYIQSVSILMGYCCLSIGSIFSEVNGFVGIGALRLNNPFLFFLNGFLISVAIINIFNNFKNKHKSWITWLAFWGRNSIVILCTNNLLIEIIRLIDYKLSGNWLLNTGVVGAIIMTISIILIEWGMVILCRQNKLRILFGKD